MPVRSFAGRSRDTNSSQEAWAGKGNCWDNAVAESFFKTLKMELIYQNRYETRKEAELSIFEYIEGFYNSHRRHKCLENRTILEFNQLIINKFKIAA